MPEPVFHATATLARLVREDAIGQLLRRDGAMARLGSEQGALMLDWVDALPCLLANQERIEQAQAEAPALITRGVRHLVWAGMGGSALTVQVLRALGFCDGGLTIHPLDSTDPAALNALLRDLAAAKGVTLPAPLTPNSRPASRAVSRPGAR